MVGVALFDAGRDVLVKLVQGNSGNHLSVAKLLGLAFVEQVLIVGNQVIILEVFRLDDELSRLQLHAPAAEFGRAFEHLPIPAVNVALCDFR